MSWDIVLFNSLQVINNVKDLDETKLVPVDFYALLDEHFPDIKKQESNWEINGVGFSIVCYPQPEPVSNTLLNLYGAAAIFELVILARKQGWQIYDSGMDQMVNLDHPETNGYQNFRNYIEQVKGDK